MIIEAMGVDLMINLRGRWTFGKDLNVTIEKKRPVS